MITTVRSLVANRRLLKDFVARDLKARYVGSSMGFFWSVIFPIVNLIVYMYVFRVILHMRFQDGASTADMGVWMLTGITAWAAFAETLSRTTNCLVENSNLIQKVVFPSEILPVYLTTSSLINMLIGLPIVLLALIYVVYVNPDGAVEVASLLQDTKIKEEDPSSMGLGLGIVMLPVLMVLQGVFTVGLGYLLSAFNLYWRDTYHLIGVGTTVWMFATPLFYPDVMVRGRGFGWVLEVNPMYWLIDNYREILVFAHWPDWWNLGRFALVALVVFWAGSRFFMAQKARFPDLL
jgi:ABC-type polysaccharide/polyol phosphate export permease